MPLDAPTRGAIDRRGISGLVSKCVTLEYSLAIIISRSIRTRMMHGQEKCAGSCVGQANIVPRLPLAGTAERKQQVRSIPCLPVRRARPTKASRFGDRFVQPFRGRRHQRMRPNDATRIMVDRGASGSATMGNCAPGQSRPTGQMSWPPDGCQLRPAGS